MTAATTAQYQSSPIGRIVQGDVFEPQTKDQQGAPRVVRSGPNAGQPAPQWFIALAFAKNDPAWPAFWAHLVNVAAAAWPTIFPQGPQPGIPLLGGCVMQTFAFKVMDGDGYDTTGKHNATKEGMAAHWVVRFSSGFKTKAYRQTSPGVYVELTDPKSLKRGDYGRVSYAVAGNGNAQKPGIYVNWNMFELVATGQEIVSGPDAAQVFGGAAPAALPPGAIPLGVAPAMPGAPAVPYAPPQPAQPPPAAPATPVYAPTPAPPAPVQPYPGYMQQGPASSPVPAPAAPPPPAPPPITPVGPQMTAAATSTYEAYIAAGWTDDQLVVHGLMLPG